MLGFSCTVMTTWEGIVQLFGINFQNGGFAGSLYVQNISQQAKINSIATACSSFG
jgi:hypothetical protein